MEERPSPWIIEECRAVYEGFQTHVSRLGVKWRIGLLLSSLLEHSDESWMRTEAFEEVEKALGAQYKKGVLQECVAVYESFPSLLCSVSRGDGKDVPAWALHEQREYTRYWKVYVFLAREKAFKTEMDRLSWAKMRGLNEAEIREVIEYAKGKGMLGTPLTALKAWRAGVEAERRKRAMAAEAAAKERIRT